MLAEEHKGVGEQDIIFDKFELGYLLLQFIPVPVDWLKMVIIRYQTVFGAGHNGVSQLSNVVAIGPEQMELVFPI